MTMRNAVLASILCIAASGATAAVCMEDKLDIRMSGSVTRFAVEIADTVEERATGLMNREFMGQFSGMLFVYDRPQSVTFWMKDTLIPLDLLFVDESGVVQRIHENAIPLDLTGLPGGNQIQYVLEINGGMSELLGLKVGAQIRHPDIQNDLAIWPCTK